jgi:hypothetical protein
MLRGFEIAEGEILVVSCGPVLEPDEAIEDARLCSWPCRPAEGREKLFDILPFQVKKNVELSESGSRRNPASTMVEEYLRKALMNQLVLVK